VQDRRMVTMDHL